MVRVSVGIIIVNSMILVCQRKKNSRYPLRWEFPGGKVEDGESVEECLHRELREELSIDATIGLEFHRQSWVYPDAGSFEVFYHLVPSFTGDPQNNVFESIRWIPVGDLRGIDMLDGNREVVQMLTRSTPAA